MCAAVCVLRGGMAAEEPSVELERTRMTLSSKGGKVTFSPKEGVMSASYPKWVFDEASVRAPIAAQAAVVRTGHRAPVAHVVSRGVLRSFFTPRAVGGAGQLTHTAGGVQSGPRLREDRRIARRYAGRTRRAGLASGCGVRSRRGARTLPNPTPAPTPPHLRPQCPRPLPPSPHGTRAHTAIAALVAPGVTIVYKVLSAATENQQSDDPRLAQPRGGFTMDTTVCSILRVRDQDGKVTEMPEDKGGGCEVL